METKNKKDIQGFQLYVELAGLGLELAVPIGIGAWIDENFQTKPAAVLIGMFLGVTTVILHIKKRLF
ncbi:MAG: AtpZ/AtpI family protein [Planctomycetia bacterium]|jgi:F0F1-type ATP synthase assembly protein I